MTDTAQGRGKGWRALTGADTEWSRRRIARGLTIKQLAALSNVPRSVVGLIDQGRMVPSPTEAAALLRVLEGEEHVA